MKTQQQLKDLRNIKTESLAEVMNISSNMARKYKREPWKYDPPTTKAVAVEQAFEIPVVFWKDIKSFISESLTKDTKSSEVQENK